ncbi:MAG TPA: hypothetical protein VFX85_02330 [Solirubrobacterales bacterium]|nr:hypothetical protein [Solirubrobacterales bacterium]
MDTLRKLSGLLAVVGGLLALGGGTAMAAGPPLVNASWVTTVTATSARVNAEVSANGFATNIRFEYLTSAAYEANVKAAKEPFTGALRSPAGAGAPIGSGTGFVKPLRQLEELSADTGYRYRLVAINSAGTTLGPVRGFHTETGTPAFALPDGRGWEMVTPIEKNGGGVGSAEGNLGGGVFQAAAQGGAVTYTAGSSYAVPAGSPGASQYIARRASSGWSTENVTLSLFSGSYPNQSDSGVPYQLFSPDLAAALVTNGKRCRGSGSDCPVANPPLPGSGAPAGYRNYYLRTSATGSAQALLSNTGIAGLGLGPEDFEVGLAGATEDLGQVVLSSCAAITANATEIPGTGSECDPAEQNLYRWAAGSLVLVNLKPGDAEGTPGAELAAPSGAIATSGSRVYWTDGAALYLREGSQTFPVDDAIGGGGSFETAAADGSIAYLTKAGHLYRFDATTKALTDLTPAADVEGVLGSSASGNRVYYLSASGLFLRDGGVTTKVTDGADASNYPPATGTARVTPDGSRVAFLASAPIGEYDNDGKSEVYLFALDGGGLVCASCNPTGERPRGPSSIPGAIRNGAALQAYKPRNLAAGGNRLYFDSLDSLAPQDTNNEPDVYQWEAAGVGSCADPDGCVNLISDGRSEGGASFVDASGDGGDVYFATDGALVPEDPGSIDLYDARVGGGFPLPPVVIPCNGDACQPLPPEPEDPVPGTLLSKSGGNPPLAFPSSAGKGKKGKGKKKSKGKRKAKGKSQKRAAAGKGRLR